MIRQSPRGRHSRRRRTSGGDRLLRDGHEVLCVDNLFAGTKRNIEHLGGHPRFEFMRHDSEEIRRLTGANNEVIRCPAQENDPLRRRPTSPRPKAAWLGAFDAAIRRPAENDRVSPGDRPADEGSFTERNAPPPIFSP